MRVFVAYKEYDKNNNLNESCYKKKSIIRNIKNVVVDSLQIQF